MTDAHWAPDPTGRHDQRLWDGRRWSDRVADAGVARLDSGPLPLFAPAPDRSADTLLGGTAPTPLPAGAPGPSAPARPAWPRHLLLGVVTAGLWGVVGPAVHWLRRRSWLTATAWLSAWICVGGLVVVLTQLGTSTGALGGRPAEEFPFLAPLPSTRQPAADRTPPAPTPTPSPSAASPSETTSAPATTQATPTRPPTAATTAARRTTQHPRSAPRPTATRPPAPRPSPPRPPSRTPTVTPDATEPAPQLDPRFPNCAQARANGYGPYRRDTDPEYAWYPDKDGDGIACERGRRDA